MFNLATFFLFIIGFIYFFIRKKKTKNKELEEVIKPSNIQKNKTTNSNYNKTKSKKNGKNKNKYASSYSPNKSKNQKDNISFVKRHSLEIYIITFLFVYILSSIIVNEMLIENYLENIDKGLLTYRTIKEDLLDEFEFKDFPDETEYALIIDYMEGRYRAFYYEIDGEEIYQEVGYGLLYYEEDTLPARRQVSLRYNNYLKLFFFQYKTKTYNIVVGRKEDMKFLN